MTGLIASVHSVLASTPARWAALTSVEPADHDVDTAGGAR